MANGVIVPHGIRLVRPAPALEPYIRYYGHRAAHLVNTVVVHPVHARAAPILDFEFGDAEAILYIPSNGKPPILSPRSVLIGIQTGRRGELHISGTVDSFAILFQPDGLDLLFALPAQEFTDRSFDAESVFGRMIARFHERSPIAVPPKSASPSPTNFSFSMPTQRAPGTESRRQPIRCCWKPRLEASRPWLNEPASVRANFDEFSCKKLA
ncbi:MAG: DUF6597 domain-containing transcriptional factor [Alloacidobacterium sp.]|jgi:hypothetical protein